MPPNSPDILWNAGLSRLGRHAEKNNVLQAKPKMTDELKSPCRRSGKSCLQNTLTRCWRASSNCTAYIAVVANGGQSKHLQQLCPSPSLHPYLITNKPALSEPTTDYRWRLRSKRRKMGVSCLKQHNLSLSDSSHSKRDDKVYVLLFNRCVKFREKNSLAPARCWNINKSCSGVTFYVHPVQ